MINPAAHKSLCTHDLTAGFHGKPVVSGLNLACPASSFTALLGRNGSGKTTLLKTLAGLLPPVAGRVEWSGREPSQFSRKERARWISFVSTEPVNLHYLSVYELVSAGRYPYTPWTGTLCPADRTIIDHALHLTGITGIAYRKITRISDGERQKALIARAIAQDTPVILLDEPTAWLDLPSRYEIISLLAKLASDAGKTIVCSTHELPVAVKKAQYLWLIAGVEEFYSAAPSEMIEKKILQKVFEGIELYL